MLSAIVVMDRALIKVNIKPGSRVMNYENLNKAMTAISELRRVTGTQTRNLRESNL
jgi:hypothetical protein